MNEHAPASKFQRYRQRKRADGFRELRMWVPDLRSPVWQAALARETASIAAGAGDREWDLFVDAEIASWADWTWPADAAR